VKKKFVTLFLLFIFVFSAFSDNIRGEIKNLLDIKTEKVEADFKIFELTGFFLTKTPFVEGLELTLTIPEDLSKFRDSFMLNLYYNLNSEPNINLKSYRGELLLSKVIPVSKKMFISIPMTQALNNNLLPGSIVTKKIDFSESPLLLSISPVMKGIPSSVLLSTFKLEIIPMLSNKGILSLNIDNSTFEKNYTIILNGKKLEQKSEYILEEGIQHIIIKSPFYKEISRSFVISRGESTEIDIILEQLISTVRFEAPEGAVVILNGEKINPFTGKDIDINPGEHVVRMEMGDYFLSKKFTVETDKNYKISLFLDILVQDN